MNIKEVISSGILESFVLGNASTEEIAFVNDLCKKHPEVLQEIERIEEDLILYAEINAPQISQSTQEKIFNEINSKLSQLKEKENTNNIIPIAVNSSIKFYRISIAASFLLLIGCSIYILSLRNKLNQLNPQKSIFKILL